jgi:hypothetical protein
MYLNNSQQKHIANNRKQSPNLLHLPLLSMLDFISFNFYYTNDFIKRYEL